MHASQSVMHASQPARARVVPAAALLVGTLVWLLLPACTEPNPAFTGAHYTEAGADHGVFHDGGWPDLGPLPDGLTCSPGTFIKCRSATQLLVCDSNGTAALTVSCQPFICNATSGRCNECDPSSKPYCVGNFAVSCSSDGLKTSSYCSDGCDGGKCQGCTKTTYYKDADSDGYGDPNASQQACTQPLGYVENNQDCDDLDWQANPLNSNYHPYKTLGKGDYDFNCDGKDEKQYTDVAYCYKSGGSCVGSGWDSSVPECGSWGQWVQCKSGSGTCYESLSWKMQPCR